MLQMSKSQIWDEAKLEWELIGVRHAADPATCLCSHHPIFEICILHNAATNISAEVGNVCVNHFMGIDSNKIFHQIQRVQRDITKPLGFEATYMLHKQGVLNWWEYEFQLCTLRKRVLSIDQYNARLSINKRVNHYMKGVTS